MLNNHTSTTGIPSTGELVANGQLHGPHTNSINFKPFFEDIAGSLEKLGCKCFYGKEATIITMDGTWTIDFLCKYKNTTVLMMEAATSHVKWGKKIKTVKGKIQHDKTIHYTEETQPPHKTLDKTDPTSQLREKGSRYGGVKAYCEINGYHSPIMAHVHAVRSVTIEDSRVAEIKEYYCDKFPYQMFKYYGVTAVTINLYKEDENKSELFIGDASCVDRNELKEELTSAVKKNIASWQEEGNLPKGIPAPLGSKYDEKERLAEVKHYKEETKIKLKEKGKWGQGALGDWEVMLWKFAKAHFDEILGENETKTE